jgi:dihydrofolate reductase
MRSLGVTMSVTLDGVVQGLGRPDEDTRGGFSHGGWGTSYTDEVMGREMAKGMGEPGDMLFGRRTWDDFRTVWKDRDDGNPFTEHMNAATKYVASTTLTDVDAWPNSVLLPGDAVDSVRRLKRDGDRALAIVGSAALVRSLHAAGLIDRYTLLLHPLTLGAGARMFDERAPLTELRLVDSVATTTGVIIARYERG